MCTAVGETRTEHIGGAAPASTRFGVGASVWEARSLRTLTHVGSR
jgi:hypothetical protein